MAARQFEDQLREFLQDKPYEDHVHGRVFALSNKNQDADRLEDLKKVIEDLAADQTYTIAASWNKVKKSLKETKRDWLTMREVKVNIKQEEVCAALTYFHQVGDLVYFKEVPDFIVVNPTWLVEMLSKVISIPIQQEQQRFKGSGRHWKNLIKEAIVHDDVLRAVWPEGAVRGLTAIMTNYALLLPVPRDYKVLDPSTRLPPGQVYLVPSLLPSKFTEEMEQATEVSGQGKTPITLVFPDNFIPVGMTSRLITSLIQDHSWKAVGQIYKDASTFEVKKDGGICLTSIVQKSGKIEISCENDLPDSSHLQHTSLKHILAKLGTIYAHQDFSVCITCDCKALIPTAGPEYKLESGYSCPSGEHPTKLYLPSPSDITWFSREDVRFPLSL